MQFAGDDGAAGADQKPPEEAKGEDDSTRNAAWQTFQSQLEAAADTVAICDVFKRMLAGIVDGSLRATREEVLVAAKAKKAAAQAAGTWGRACASAFGDVLKAQLEKKRECEQAAREAEEAERRRTTCCQTTWLKPPGGGFFDAEFTLTNNDRTLQKSGNSAYIRTIRAKVGMEPGGDGPNSYWLCVDKCTGGDFFIGLVGNKYSCWDGWMKGSQGVRWHVKPGDGPQYFNLVVDWEQGVMEIRNREGAVLQDNGGGEDAPSKPIKDDHPDGGPPFCLAVSMRQIGNQVTLMEGPPEA
eukprot:g2966.t1